MRILNLYAGVGGNRAGWGSGHDVTAVEYDPAIAAAYRARFPSDVVIVGDAAAHLIRAAEYDMVWASPPCQSHGQYRHNVGVRAKGYAPLIPDMTGLYGAIVYLQHYYRGCWIVENVKPYYPPLIPPTTIMQRHLIWSSFPIPELIVPAAGLRTRNRIADYADAGVDLTGTGIANKRQVLRNMVDPIIGAHILTAALAARGEPAPDPEPEPPRLGQPTMF